MTPDDTLKRFAEEQTTVGILARELRALRAQLREKDADLEATKRELLESKRAYAADAEDALSDMEFVNEQRKAAIAKLAEAERELLASKRSYAAWRRGLLTQVRAKDATLMLIRAHVFVEETAPAANRLQRIAAMCDAALADVEYAATRTPSPDAGRAEPKTGREPVFSRPECPFKLCDTKAPHAECSLMCRYTQCGACNGTGGNSGYSCEYCSGTGALTTPEKRALRAQDLAATRTPDAGRAEPKTSEGSDSGLAPGSSRSSPSTPAGGSEGAGSPPGVCKLCGQPKYHWQEFCGAACCAKWEAGERPSPREGAPAELETEKMRGHICDWVPCFACGDDALRSRAEPGTSTPAEDGRCPKCGYTIDARGCDCTNDPTANPESPDAQMWREERARAGASTPVDPDDAERAKAWLYAHTSHRRLRVIESLAAEFAAAREAGRVEGWDEAWRAPLHEGGQASWDEAVKALRGQPHGWSGDEWADWLAARRPGGAGPSGAGGAK